MLSDRRESSEKKRRRALHILQYHSLFYRDNNFKKERRKNKIEKDKNKTAMNQSVKPVEVRSQQDLKLLLWQYENNRSITSSWHEAFLGLYVLIGMVAVFANGLVVIAVFRNKKVRSPIFYMIASLILLTGFYLALLAIMRESTFILDLLLCFLRSYDIIIDSI